MNHSGDANKMVGETPRTETYVLNPLPQVVSAEWARQLERELNAAHARIQSLIEERDRANRLAEWKWNLRDEFQLLLGTDKIEEGIEAVKELKRRIKRLEEAGQRVDDAAHSIQDWSGTVLGDALDELNKAKEDKP